MNSLIDYLFVEYGIGYAVFNRDLKLIRKSNNLSNLLNLSKINLDESLFEIFPEFFGLENDITNVISSKIPKLVLDQINKVNDNGDIRYLKYTLLKLPGADNILLSIYDSTIQSQLRQTLQQQKNELKILQESVAFLKNNSIDNFLGNSNVVIELKKFISKVSKVKNTTILLTGESGTGKTLIARAIHSLSFDDQAPFIEINCATIPESLIESEIFGHVKGAFTNAVENKKGLIEEADGGTLFLDEIGELPISLQPKLLTFLETKKFRPVGSTKEVAVNARIITATNVNLKEAVKEKKFREDLYYRINVVSSEIPSLKERKDDIILLANHFIKVLSNDQNKKNIKLSEAAEKKLMDYSWPGNIRELKNCIERALIFCDTDIIESSDLALEVENSGGSSDSYYELPESGVSLEEVEKRLIENALEKTRGNQTQAAKLLHLSLDTFRYRLKKHNIVN